MVIPFAKVQKKMHKYKKNEQKFIFRLVFSVFGLRGVAVYRAPAKLALWEEEESRSSNAVSGSLYDKRILTTRWDCPMGNVGALEGTTLPLYVRTKSAHTQAGEYIFPKTCLLFALYMPPTYIGTSLEPDWNLIGTSSNNYRYFKP